MKTNLILLFILLPFTASAQTLTVKQDGTGDFTTIQAAVDSAQNGDTVLVWPGTYYENVIIDHKNITLGSLTLTTGDNAYIAQTIIDGNKKNSCLKVQYCDSSTICGITLQNGYNHSSSLQHGGGILVLSTNYAAIKSCNVNNNVTKKYGGGICYYRANGFLTNVTVTNNHAYDRGGGILLLKGTLTFDTVNRCNIYENYAAVGTDFYKLGSPDTVYFAVDTFTVQNPDYYYAFSKDDNELPQNDIVFNILHHKIEQDSTDLYVAPWGDNTNSGLTPDQPLKTISFALLKAASDSVSPDTIHVADGTYSDTLTGEHYPLSLKSYVTIKGESRDSTILDGEGKIYHAVGINTATYYALKNITLVNGFGNKNTAYEVGSFQGLSNPDILLENLLFTNNYGYLNSCGSLYNGNNSEIINVEFKDNTGGEAFRIINTSTGVHFDTVYLKNCKFTHNIPDFNTSEGAFGGGLSIVCAQSDTAILITTVLINCLFTDNITQFYDWSFPNSLNLYGASAYVVNNTFTDNNSQNIYGANIGVTYYSKMNVINSIMYNNNPAEFYMYNQGGWNDNELTIKNSIVDGGESEIRILSSGNNLHYDTTNLDTDPLFYGGAEFPYNLSDESPCIDAGTLDLPQFILDHMPDVDLAGNPRIFNGKIDMGAYEWNPSVGAGEHRISNTEHRTPNLKVFPNPFSTTAYISAQWQTAAQVDIEVYNTAGLLVKTLLSGRQLPGSCKIPWEGRDNNGKYLPSGIYLVVLRVDGKEKESVKVVKE